MDEQPNSMTQPLADAGTLVSCHKCKRSFKNAMALRMHKIRKHRPGGGWNTAANFGKGKGSNKKSHANLNRKGGKPWTPAQREKFNSTWRSKQIQRARGLFKETRKPKIQIVYPDPEAAVTPRHTLKYCPACGEHLEGWRKN
jgi:hypothetical protein